MLLSCLSLKYTSIACLLNHCFFFFLLSLRAMSSRQPNGKGNSCSLRMDPFCSALFSCVYLTFVTSFSYAALLTMSSVTVYLAAVLFASHACSFPMFVNSEVRPSLFRSRFSFSFVWWTLFDWGKWHEFYTFSLNLMSYCFWCLYTTFVSLL